MFDHGATNTPLGGFPSFLLAPQLWYELYPAGNVYVMKSDRYVPGGSWPDGGRVGAGVGLGVGAGVAVGAGVDCGPPTPPPFGNAITPTTASATTAAAAAAIRAGMLMSGN